MIKNSCIVDLIWSALIGSILQGKIVVVLFLKINESSKVDQYIYLQPVYMYTFNASYAIVFCTKFAICIDMNIETSGGVLVN